MLCVYHFKKTILGHTKGLNEIKKSKFMNNCNYLIDNYFKDDAEFDIYISKLRSEYHALPVQLKFIEEINMNKHKLCKFFTGKYKLLDTWI